MHFTLVLWYVAWYILHHLPPSQCCFQVAFSPSFFSSISHSFSMSKFTTWYSGFWLLTFWWPERVAAQKQDGPGSFKFYLLRFFVFVFSQSYVAHWRIEPIRLWCIGVSRHVYVCFWVAAMLIRKGPMMSWPRKLSSAHSLWPVSWETRPHGLQLSLPPTL